MPQGDDTSSDLPRIGQEVRAEGSSTVQVAGRDILQLQFGSPEPTWESTDHVSVQPPQVHSPYPLQGRADLLDRIRQRIGGLGQPSQDRNVLILHGMGGCSKSSVALRAAHQAQESGATVWWVYAGGQARLSAGMRQIADELGVPAAQIEAAWLRGGGAPDLVWRFLNQARSPWVLVFDNADEPELLAAGGAEVADGTGWLRPPITDNGLVIVTSRDGNSDTWGQWAQLLPVGTLDPDYGGQILLDIVGDVGGTPEDARHLAERLGGLPLALTRAAKYIDVAQRGPVWRHGSAVRTFADYQAAIDERFSGPLPQPADQPAEQLGLERVYQTCEMSLDLLARRGLPEARPLLRIISCWAPAPLPYAGLLDPGTLSRSAIFADIAEDRLRVLIQGLADLALVELRVDDRVPDPTYSYLLTLHPLIRDVNRSSADVQEAEHDYHQLLIDLSKEATRGLDPDMPENWHAWHYLAPHFAKPLVSQLSDACRDAELTTNSLLTIRLVGRYLLAAGLPQQAEQFLREVAELEQSALPPAAVPALLSVQHEYARSLLDQGRLTEAEARLRALLEERKKWRGPDHMDTLATRHKLARAVLEQGRWEEAESALRVVVAGERAMRGSEHNDTLTMRHSVAKAVLMQQGRAREAEASLQEIITIRQRQWPEDHPETLAARHTHARALLAQNGRSAEAEAELLEIIEIRKRHWGPDNLETLAVRFSLARAYANQGSIERARAELTKVLHRREETLGISHPVTELTRRELNVLSTPGAA